MLGNNINAHIVLAAAGIIKAVVPGGTAHFQYSVRLLNQAVKMLFGIVELKVGGA